MLGSKLRDMKFNMEMKLATTLPFVDTKKVGKVAVAITLTATSLVILNEAIPTKRLLADLSVRLGRKVTYSELSKAVGIFKELELWKYYKSYDSIVKWFSTAIQDRYWNL